MASQMEETLAPPPERNKAVGAAQAFTATTEYLEIFDGSGHAQRMTLTGKPIVVGRAPGVHIRFDHSFISRQHAEFYPDPFGRWWVRDLGSRNGIKVNGSPVTERVLQPRDLVQIGPFTIALRMPFVLPTITPSDGATAAVRLLEGHPTEMIALHDLKRPNISSWGVSTMMKFGYQLVGVDNPSERLAQLCMLMVQPEFQGKACVMLRMVKGKPDEAPQILCRPKFSAEWRRTSLDVSRRLVGIAMTKEQPVLGKHVCADTGDSEQALEFGIMSMSAVAYPLRADAKVMDILYVILPPEGGTADWPSLASLATQQFLTAESAFEAEKQAESHATINWELKKAREIQQRLVPKPVILDSVQAAVSYEPSRWVGGDYVDAFITPDQKLFLAVASQKSKSQNLPCTGLQAAMVVSQLHTATRTCFRTPRSLEDVVKTLHATLTDTLGCKSVVTLQAVLMDLATGAIDYCNAGLPAGVVLEPNGDKRTLEACPDLSLGDSSCNEPFVFKQDELAKGSALLLYTHGVPNITNTLGEKLGHDPLANQLRTLSQSPAGSEAKTDAATLAEKLAAWIKQLQSGRVTNHDLTFAILKRP